MISWEMKPLSFISHCITWVIDWKDQQGETNYSAKWDLALRNAIKEPEFVLRLSFCLKSFRESSLWDIKSFVFPKDCAVWFSFITLFVFSKPFQWVLFVTDEVIPSFLPLPANNTSKFSPKQFVFWVLWWTTHTELNFYDHQLLTCFYVSNQRGGEKHTNEKFGWLFDSSPTAHSEAN